MDQEDDDRQPLTSQNLPLIYDLNNVIDHPEELPPAFAPYEADFFEIGSGNRVSHDSHLNSDGEALYRFLLSQAEIIPSCVLHCRGKHVETRTRWTSSRNSDGHVESQPETRSETVTDFDFYINATFHQSTKAVHWTVADDVPAYRGLMVPEFGGIQGTHLTSRSERKAHQNWLKERNAMGLPPWSAFGDTAPNGRIGDIPLKSSKTIRQWADEYCDSPKLLKEFVYDKLVYGWNFQQLECSIRALIRSTRYDGDIDVSFEISRSKVLIRADNRLSRAFSNKWLKFFSILFLVFPFIWLFKRFHSRGGGQWEVCGAAYALKRPVPFVEYANVLGGPDQALGSTKVAAFSGQIEVPERPESWTEEQWLRKWEGNIRRAVLGRYQSTIPMQDIDLRENYNLL